MKNIILILTVFFSTNVLSQEEDTLYIIFNDTKKEMERVEFLESIGAEKSYNYIIEQTKKVYPYRNKFKFSHFRVGKKTLQTFGGELPLILKKHRSFLKGKKVLDIEFFRTTPYSEVTKTFEEEGSWEQDVMIFMIDVDEIKNDSIVLREVDFSRPVKQ